MKRCIILVLALAATTLFTGAAKAISLADMINNNGTFQIGDKLFSDFALASQSIRAEDIDVMTIGSGTDPDWWGLSFTGPFAASNGSTFDASLFYRVTVTDPQWKLSDIHQAFNLAAQGDGGVIGIGETVFDAGFGAGNVVAQSSVGFLFGTGDVTDPPGELVQGDQLVIAPPLSTVWVTKNVYLEAADSGAVSASIIFQRFSQSSGESPNTIPDAGGTVVLLGAAALALGLLGRPRKRW